jgi:predicted amidohydrolase YtcJ
LVVLSDDYLTVPDERLRDLRVSMTMVGGLIVHERA